MRAPTSLVRRLIVWQAGAMVVAWLVLSAWLVVQMMAFGNGDLDRRMLTLAQTLAEAASAAGGDRAHLEARLQRAQAIFVDGVINEADASAPYVPLYQVWSATGELLYRTPGVAAEPLAGADGVFARFEAPAGTLRTVAALSADGRVRVDVGESVQQRWTSNWPVLRIIGLGQLVILLWCVGVTWVAARRGFAPLTTLARQLAARRPGDLAPLQDARRYAETAPIVDEINGLLAREGRRLETERGFLADAAHELRTPLAAINAQAHLVVTTDSGPTRALALTELQQGMERVSHLLNQLLTMARLEALPVLGSPEDVDLADLCRQRLAALSQLARARAIALALDAPEVLHARVHRAGFVSIVDNLVDNAIRYTPSGGQVEVRLLGSAEAIELQVRDDGPGIAPQHRERIFERFYRIPGTTAQGSGLGLAIVQRVVASHAATLRFVDGLSGRGVGWVLRLPRTLPDRAG